MLPSDLSLPSLQWLLLLLLGRSLQWLPSDPLVRLLLWRLSLLLLLLLP
ncbi:hypothetical protein J5TS1_15270 [Bacillus licheniformis]|nr:hypothetical protein J5TS1_15270 [Bacillus licheniformis]